MSESEGFEQGAAAARAAASRAAASTRSAAELGSLTLPMRVIDAIEEAAARERVPVSQLLDRLLRTLALRARAAEAAERAGGVRARIRDSDERKDPYRSDPGVDDSLAEREDDDEVEEAALEAFLDQCSEKIERAERSVEATIARVEAALDALESRSDHDAIREEVQHWAAENPRATDEIRRIFSVEQSR